MVDQETLHDAYARAGFVLYPTAFPGECRNFDQGCSLLEKHRVPHGVDNHGEIQHSRTDILASGRRARSRASEVWVWLDHVEPSVCDKRCLRTAVSAALPFVREERGLEHFAWQRKNQVASLFEEKVAFSCA